MFSAFGHIVGRPLSWFAGQSPSTHHAGSQATSTSTSSANLSGAMSSVAASDPYEPSVLDVLVVKAMLNRAFDLPLELVNTILDMAEYWPHSSAVEHRRTISGGPHGQENQLLVRSQPLGFNSAIQSPQSPDLAHMESLRRPLERPYSLEAFQTATGSPEPLLEHPCRKIVFSIRSHDQGWSSELANHGTYRSSWTWFDAGLERLEAGSGEAEESEAVRFEVNRLRTIWPEVRERQDPDQASPSSTGTGPGQTAPKEYEFHHELLPNQDHTVQRNVHGKRQSTDHKVVWSWTDDIDPDSPRAEEELGAVGRGKGTGNGEFVRSLTLGDVVTVWGRARFPGWSNTVESVQIDVYWAV